MSDKEKQQEEKLEEQRADTLQTAETAAEPVAAPAMTPWQRLREAREAAGLSVVDVAHHLKLTPRQVEAMEAGDLAHLPGPAFARGFIRNYARLLHLDPVIFNEVLEVPREVPLVPGAMSLGQMPGPARSRFSALPALAAALVLLGLITAGWHYGWFEPRDEQYLADMMSQSGGAAESSAPLVQSGTVIALAQSEASGQSEVAGSSPRGESIETAAVVLSAGGSAPATASVPAATSAPAPAASTPVAVSRAASVPAALPAAAAASASVAPAPKPAVAASVPAAASLPAVLPKGARRLHFSFEADAWVEVRDATGKTIFAKLNPSGSEQDLQGMPPFELVVGNAPHVHLTYDGKAIDLASRTKSNVAHLTLP